MISVQLVPPLVDELKRQIMDELMSQLDAVLDGARNDAQNEIRNLTKTILKSTLFYGEFFQSDLRGEFGIRPHEVAPRIDTIIDAIANDTHLFYTRVSLSGPSSIVGGWTLAMGTNLFADLKNLPEGITITEKGERLPWLEWLLTIGDQLVIADYRILFRLGRGRSGYAIMIPDTTIGWRIPVLFSGTDHDNWITRAVLKNINEYSRVVERAIKRHIP